MTRLWTIIGVADVAHSGNWYQTLAGQLDMEPDTNPATGTLEFGLRDPDGYFVIVSSNQPS